MLSGPFVNHGMARPQVADGGDALQLWREAANILNKQSRTAEKAWSSRFRVGCGTKRLTVKDNFVTKCHIGLIKFILWNFIREIKVALNYSRMAQRPAKLCASYWRHLPVHMYYLPV
jgi:hypothetical protein